MNRFTNRTAIVTGGASGIGQAAARRLFAEGANVVVVDVNDDGAHGVAESLGDAERAYAVALDITDRARVHQMMEQAAAQFGHLHALVNCAGIRGVTSVLDAEHEQWARVHAVNLEGTLILSQEFARLALNAGHPAAIVNLASLAGITAVPNRAPYVTSKHAVVGLTRAMAIELGTAGIRVNAITPGGGS
jgi:meso-butanediol dehydrogenase/(S,S)-butanediol dehydrogenase/diacetyl reductase